MSYSFSRMCSDPNFCAKYGVNVVEGDSRDIICSPSLPLVQTKPEQWAPWGFNSEYCLSEAVPETCSYNANLYTIVIVIICNAAKAITILYVAFRHQDNPLRTLGEAIQSFLNATRSHNNRTVLAFEARCRGSSRERYCGPWAAEMARCSGSASRWRSHSFRKTPKTQSGRQSHSMGLYNNGLFYLSGLGPRTFWPRGA